MIHAIDFDVIVGSIEIPNSPEGPFSVEALPASDTCGALEYLHRGLWQRQIAPRPRLVRAYVGAVVSGEAPDARHLAGSA